MVQSAVSPARLERAKLHTKASPSGSPKGDHSANAAEEKHGQVGQRAAAVAKHPGRPWAAVP